MFDTLVGDADGVYDTGNFNDRLLLGLKGTARRGKLAHSPALLSRHLTVNVLGCMAAGRMDSGRRVLTFSRQVT